MKTFAEFLKEDQEPATEQAAPTPVTVSRQEPPSMTTAKSADAPKDATVKLKKVSELVDPPSSN